MQIVALILIIASWLITNLIFNPENIDPTIIILFGIFLFYRIKYKFSVSKTLELWGVKPITLLPLLQIVLILLVLSFSIPQILALTLNVDMTELMQNQGSVGQVMMKIANNHPTTIALLGIIVFPIYGTFFEELLFRGLILRKLMVHNFQIANITQSLVFGSLHFLSTLPFDIPINWKIFVLLYTTIVAYILGYGYKLSNNNLVVTWSAHYLANCTTGIIFVFYGRFL